MNEVERKLKAQEIAQLIGEINQSAHDLYNNSSISDTDKKNMETFILNIRETSIEDDEALEQSIGEAYGHMFLLSTKAMHKNVSDLNKVSDKEIPENLKKNIQNMELSLSNVIKSLEEGNEELYNDNIDKIENIAEDLQSIKNEIEKMAKSKP